MTARLLLQQASVVGATTPASIDLDENREELIIGRSKTQADIVLDVPVENGKASYLISRRHAKLRRVASRWVLSDVGSVNGLQVNAARLCVGVEHALSDGDVVSLGSSVRALNYKYEEPRKKRRRVVAPSGHGVRATSARLAAAEARAAAAEAVAVASTAAAFARRRAAAARALAHLRCPPCGEPFACACVLPCGHALDEACFLAHASSDCPMCGAILRRPPHRSAHIDAAVEALVADDDDLREAHDRRLAEADCARRAARDNPHATPLVRPYLDDQQPPKKVEEDLVEPGRRDDDNDDDDPVCDGCGEVGHDHARCPYRSDLSDDDDDDE
ncbi:hypothetical protein CTAYLR_007576 [Chrysophaeum taylorii]|uniref:FHA domain-containing protein n=1 Tax=Chrysophaeum taylorii TaxID=2483200 RepID=A0AAD7UGS7_9STRA|nr:hypothetical protein CTAYLR_007576 [Chrysophaeum taylorii]